MISLKEHQYSVIPQLQTGSILCGGVGSGKSITSLYYFLIVECGGKIVGPNFLPLTKPKDLYIITTARKRDSLEWEKECTRMMLSSDRSVSISMVKVTIDSWNNIKKYENVTNCFFILDEQRIIGSGAWVKSFIKIAKKNNWILLSATPGDTWMDYIPVFVANGFYKNRTEFLRRHVVYNNFSRFPKIDHYIETGTLVKLRNSITVNMAYEKKTTSHVIDLSVTYDQSLFEMISKKRWNPFKNEPIKDRGSLGYLMRKSVNIHKSRLEAIPTLFEKHPKLIIFYNFDYELLILESLKDLLNVETAQYNGHKHQPIPQSEKWIYLVQYTSGAEAWNCIDTNAILFYSLNYSYRLMTQSAGRIDRMNTPFKDLYYYRLISSSPMDLAIKKSLSEKKDFNENYFLEKTFASKT